LNFHNFLLYNLGGHYLNKKSFTQTLVVLEILRWFFQRSLLRYVK